MTKLTAADYAERLAAARADLLDARPGPKADRAHARIDRVVEQADRAGVLADVLALADES